MQQPRALLPKDISADEIGTLTKEFDSMLGKIDTLIHENYEKQILLQETRYKMLQAQINPHFLYNTLGTLNWLVKAGNREDACKMIVSLGDILRAALSPAPEFYRGSRCTAGRQLHRHSATSL